MKKFILGLLVGISVTAAGSAYADAIVESIVGKQVQGSFPVKVDGKQLSTVAAVIDGTSYLPVRAVGEALNKEVTFNADLGIELKEKGVTPVGEVVPTEPQVINENVQANIDELRKKIKDQQEYVENAKLVRHSFELTLDAPNAPKESVQKSIEMYNKQIAEAEQRITDYEVQIAALEAQK